MGKGVFSQSHQEKRISTGVRAAPLRGLEDTKSGAKRGVQEILPLSSSAPDM